MSIPISMMVDDSAPLINVHWWHVAEEQRTNRPMAASGEPVVRTIPVDFVGHFADIIGKWGMRGKFSVLPYPAGLGKISEGWPGCDTKALSEWIETVRTRIVPLMDITPEIVTHAKTLDLDTFKLLDENERDWARHETERTLTPYVASALRFLNEVGLEATGVTSPWDFGREVEDDYGGAICRAMKEVNGRGQSWYFLHIDGEATEFRSRVVARHGGEWLVSVFSQCKDYILETMGKPHDSAEYVRSIADRYLTESGRGGRLAELFRAGTPMVCHTHWQSLYSNGRRTGLRVLDEVGRRIASVWGEDVRWVKCCELATLVAADHPSLH